ncbi:fibroleukin-like [Saccostrea echinata]|uniref:fibroleukin-like n=1 Tax=Saccostrea echinata TaxID=191078 RepID=UPI002A7F570A|nr:fibroleukin-like [Saccostrea echinata]
MGALWVIYSIFVLFPLSQSTTISRKYTAKLDLDDKKSNDERFGEYNSTSVRECAAHCQRECSLYGFNPQMKKCRSHKKIFTSGMSREEGWRYYSHDFIPLDCKDLHADGQTNTGVYEIYPLGTITSPVRVYCEMETMDGGWTAIQKRVNGSLSFERTWTEYKNGFGLPEQDVWVGNDVIHQLTKENSSSLYVSITLQNGTTLYEMYDRFSVSNETEKYQLFLAGPATGTLGDSMLITLPSNRELSGMYFSTPDRDNDLRDIGNCAARSEIRGGWWFSNCHDAFLNGPWSPAVWRRPWYPTVVSGKTVKETLMLIRRH